MKKIAFLVVITTVLGACSPKLRETRANHLDFIELPEDLANVPESALLQLDDWLKEAEIIGLSEGEHGMNESMDFRNTYIKHLVHTRQIQVIAFETGLLESRSVNAFIQGADLNIDSVLTHSFSYTFGKFEQNRDLLMWLREINEGRKPKDRVQFYGFDMAGNAPNPYLENSSFALEECLRFIQTVDSVYHEKAVSTFSNHIPYLNIADSPEGEAVSYSALSDGKREELQLAVNELIVFVQKNEKNYVQAIGQENYDWGLRSAICAQQNVLFLEGFHQPEKDVGSREKFMLDNLKWIRQQVGGKRVILFSHLAHLSKDIARIDENGNETIPAMMFGEHLVKEFGDGYKVIGNLFSGLDYYDGVESVQENSLPTQLEETFDSQNFFLKVNSMDNIYTKRQMVGVPFKGDVWIVPSKGIDVIFYTREQHFHTKE